MTLRSRAAIQPIHHSVREVLRRGYRTKPTGMDRMPLASELQECLTEIAVSIFTDCTNVGVPFQESLLAVYLSGLENGRAITLEGETP